MTKKAKAGSNVDGVNGLTLSEFVDGIESVEVEIKQAKEKIKQTLAEAASKGYDPKAIKQIVKDRRSDTDATTRLRATVRHYMKQLGQLGDTELGQWAAAHMAQQNSANSRPLQKYVAKDEQAGEPATDL